MKQNTNRQQIQNSKQTSQKKRLDKHIKKIEEVRNGVDTIATTTQKHKSTIQKPFRACRTNRTCIKNTRTLEHV